MPLCPPVLEGMEARWLLRDEDKELGVAELLLTSPVQAKYWQGVNVFPESRQWKLDPQCRDAERRHMGDAWFLRVTASGIRIKAVVLGIGLSHERRDNFVSLLLPSSISRLNPAHRVRLGIFRWLKTWFFCLVLSGPSAF